jgi:hypothetical protein
MGMKIFISILVVVLVVVGVSYTSDQINSIKQREYNKGYEAGENAGRQHASFELEQEIVRVSDDYNKLLNDYNNLVNEANARLNTVYQPRQSIWCSTSYLGDYSTTFCR